MRFVDGRYAEGELSSAVQDIGGSLHPVLELADGETLVLFDETEVSLVEEIGHPLAISDLAVLVENAIHGSSRLPLGEVLSWRATLGEHDVVEVTIRHSRLHCEPVALS